MMPENCKEIGVRRVKYPLVPREIVSRLLGTPVYKKTGFILLQSAGNSSRWAIVSVKKTSRGRGPFRRITGVRILSLPAGTVYIRNPRIDVSNPTAMAEACEKAGRNHLIVRGRYEHVSFIAGERTVPVEVIDIVPPSPPHLLELALNAVECGLVAAPVKIQARLVDIGRLARRAGTGAVMFPCSSSAIRKRSPYFLDQCPGLDRSEIKRITLVGCARSEKIFRAVYGFKPKRISICPVDIFGKKKPKIPVLTRCCELKQKVKVIGNVALVPWDAKLPQVARALNLLVASNHAGGGC
jgi:hypothetical protein